ncbi:hypothetical protein PENTCL1PPCAC_2486, partial [Pristionchus entomophagus]
QEMFPSFLSDIFSSIPSSSSSSSSTDTTPQTENGEVTWASFRRGNIMGEPDVADLNFIGFNQDAKALSVGHHKGYASLFPSQWSSRTPVLQYEDDKMPDILLVEKGCSILRSSLLYPERIPGSCRCITS